MRTRLMPWMAGLVAVVVFSACADETPPSRASSNHSAAIARAWMDQLVVIVRQEKMVPPPASRVYGYASVTLYESVVNGMPAHQSLGGQLNDLGALPAPVAYADYHWPAVLNAAMAEVLRGLLATASAPSLDAIDMLEAEHAAHATGALSDETIRRSVDHGEKVAAVILEWAGRDGYAQYNQCPYTPPGGAGRWQPTPPGYGPAVQPCWGRLRTFAQPAANSCDAPRPIPYSTISSSAFVAQAREVRDIVNANNPELQATARYWSDDPGKTATPPGHWLSIVGQLSSTHSWTLDVAAEAYARTGIAVADAFISCWYTKFEYNYPRPVTAIREQLDPAWNSQLTTPAFPEFTSGHSVQSGAAATVLTDMLGTVAFTDHTHDAAGLPSRSYGSFHEAAAEAAESRLYGGIHFREACVVGITQGECVGRQILASVHFRR